MIGQVLADRYELLELIGGGGMALVYKARDKILNRYVAIKVLRQQFVFDDDFIRRFRREAQSAASLSHPNVVSIYDVGQEGNVHYIVMEYIEGENLNEKIKASAPFQTEQAVHIASQICDALAHAHANGIIHRDIKPHNILIGKNGRVKVTDFGIARAAAATDITQTGSVLGSVHYFSPEHAKGVSQGAKSDIYSLGIVLYQMLTNRLPFLGESPISIALKHIRDQVEEPRSVNPMIPQSVENIILKALRKDPEERYASAEEMLHELEQSLSEDKINEPKRTFPPPVHERTASESDAEHNQDEDEKPVEDPFFDRPREFEIPGDEDEEDDRNKWVKPIAWLGSIALIFIVSWIVVRAIMQSITVPEVMVPNVVGLTLDEAKIELERANLLIELPLKYEYDEEIEQGRVIAQSRSDMMVKEETPIALTISNGPPMYPMKRLIDRSLDEAMLELKRLDISDEQITLQYEESELPEGTVISQDPLPETEFNPKTVHVKLTVSEGLAAFEMPDLVGLRQSEAEAVLLRHDLVLNPDIRTEPSFEVEEGYVLKQFPVEPGQMVEPGTEIMLFVSSGYPDDVIETMYPLRVSPEEDGQVSIVQILYSDARGESMEWGTQEIDRSQVIPVQLVVSAHKPAIITYYVNGKFGDSISVSYEQAKNPESFVNQEEESAEDQSESDDEQSNAVESSDHDGNDQPSEKEEDE